MATPTAKSRPSGVSKNILFLSVALALVVGFVGGTRSDVITSVVGPVFGIKTASGSLDLSSVQTTYRQLKGNFDGSLDNQKLIDGANRGLVAAAGDKYTVYMDAKEAETFNNDISGDIGGGIGIQLGMRHDKPTVTRVLDDNPAKQAGVRQGDVITAVNNESAKDWDTGKVADKIRGEAGTTLKLTVLRGTEEKTFTMTRQTVNNPSTTGQVVNGIGIMTITRFDDKTGEEAKQVAKQFTDKHVRGIILDLRGNGGGYLTAAQDVAGLWLKNKVVVSERTNGRVTDELKSGSDAPLAGIKTAVLVDDNTASASEIVAGALQDYHAATLVGQKTFGKGTVQKVIDLEGGTILKVTVARWYTPSGKNITKAGITPDVSVKITPSDVNADKDPQLEAAKKLFG
jgi:carboxyl-terminal processing protease